LYYIDAQDAGQAVQSNRENRQILIDRVYALMLVAVLPLKGKTAAEIPQRRVWTDSQGMISRIT
jgi:hypothetical protein